MSLDWACRPKSDLLLPYIRFFIRRFIHSQTLAARHYVAPMQIEHTVEKISQLPFLLLCACQRLGDIWLCLNWQNSFRTS